jgi:hypothetical protein
MDPDNRASGQAGEKEEDGVDEAGFTHSVPAAETNADALRRVEAEVAAAGKQLRRRPRRRLLPMQLYSPLTMEISCRLWKTKAPGSAWACWAELDRLVFERRRNPLHFIVPPEREKCVPEGHVRGRAVEALKRAGLIEILERGSGAKFLVRCLWLPDQNDANRI